MPNPMQKTIEWAEANIGPGAHLQPIWTVHITHITMTPESKKLLMSSEPMALEETNLLLQLLMRNRLVDPKSVMLGYRNPQSQAVELLHW